MTAANAGPPGGPAGPGFMGGPPGGPHGLPAYGNPQQPTPPPDMAALAAGGYDPRYSMAKPPASPVHPMQSPHMSVSPSGSPAPVYPGHMQGMGTPPPPQQFQQPYNMGPTPPPPQQNGGYVPYPGPPMQQQQPQHAAVELPTQRGDGQVHELS